MRTKIGAFIKPSTIITFIPVSIAQQPKGGTVAVNSPFTFKINALGTNKKYTWYKNDIPIIGENTDILLINSCAISDDAYYYCLLENNKYSVKSDVVKLNVAYPPSIITNPIALTAAPATNVSFSVSADGTSPLYYKWYTNSVNQTTSNGTSLFLNNINKSSSGDYWVNVYNEVGSITSLSASLYILDPVIIATQPSDISINPNQSGEITLTCYGATPLTAQWRKDGNNYNSPLIDTSYEISLPIPNAQLSNNGVYDCVISNFFSSITSDKVNVYINEPPDFILNPLSALINVNREVAFTVNTTGTTPIQYQWIKNSTGAILNQYNNTYTILSVQHIDEDTYACIATNIVGSVTSTFALLSVI
jgi:hypothetical protein